MAITPQQAAAKNKGWVDKNNPNYGKAGFVGAEDEDDYVAPAAAPPPPGAPPLPTPTQGTAAYTPPSGPLMAEPTPAAPPPPIPPPAAAPERVAAPVLGPLVDTGGVAQHDPAQYVPPTPPPAPPAPQGPEVSADGGPDVAAPETLDTKFRDALMKLLDMKDPSLDDPILAAQSGAFGVQQQRAKERARSAMAERYASGSGPGVDSGAFEGGILGLEQAQGEAQGAFDADLLVGELKARRDQLMQAAALAGNQLSSDDQIALSRELGLIDADIRRATLTQQGSQFDRSLAQAGYQFEKTYGLEGRKLDENIRQFDITTETGRQAIKNQLDMFAASQKQQGKQFDVDAELRKLGITTQADLGNRDVNLRDKLGSGGLMMQLLSALIGDDQFKKGLGANIGMFNQKSLLDLLGMS